MSPFFFRIRQALLLAGVAGLAACGGKFNPTEPAPNQESCDSPAPVSPATGQTQATPITRIACTLMHELDLRSAIIQVSVDGGLVYSTALGESAPGTPATTAMHFRNGAAAAGG